jgi:glycosyltransferase involved in cell wall biosynthesis
MRILFFSHYYAPEGNAPATRVSALARRWVSLGHEVTVITSAPNVPNGVVYEGYRNHVLSEEKLVDGVRVIRVWTYLAPNKGFARRVLNYLTYMGMAWLRAMLLPRPDVLIATSPQFFCGWAGVLGKWGFRIRDPFRVPVPFILEIRDLWPESIGAVDAIRSGRVLRVIEHMEQVMYRTATKIVTVGAGYKRRLIARGVTADRIEIVMNGVDRGFLEGGTPDGERLRRQWGLEGKVVCAYVGTIGMACGLEVLIKAGELLQKEGRDDLVLLAVGDGAQRAELAARAKSQHLDNVRFPGRLSKEEIPDLLQMTDICLVHLRDTPLFESVLPSKIFEAAGMRRAVLGGLKGDAREWIAEAECGICFDPEDAEGLLRGLCTLADDAVERDRLGANGYRYVCEHLDLDDLALRYLDQLEEVSDLEGAAGD